MVRRVLTTSLVACAMVALFAGKVGAAPITLTIGEWTWETYDFTTPNGESVTASHIIVRNYSDAAISNSPFPSAPPTQWQAAPFADFSFTPVPGAPYQWQIDPGGCFDNDQTSSCAVQPDLIELAPITGFAIKFSFTDSNGMVTLFDLTVDGAPVIGDLKGGLFDVEYLVPTTVPEPTTLSLMTMGAVILSRYRRRG